jgi:hypothetical protein
MGARPVQKASLNSSEVRNLNSERSPAARAGPSARSKRSCALRQSCIASLNFATPVGVRLGRPRGLRQPRHLAAGRQRLRHVQGFEQRSAAALSRLRPRCPVSAPCAVCQPRPDLPPGVTDGGAHIFMSGLRPVLIQAPPPQPSPASGRGGALCSMAGECDQQIRPAAFEMTRMNRIACCWTPSPACGGGVGALCDV